MIVFNLPGGYLGKTHSLGRPWAKLTCIGVSGASGSAMFPEPGAKVRGATP